MLLPRVLQRLVPQFAEAQRDPSPRGMRVDYLVDKTLACRNEGVGEAVFIFLCALGNFFGVANVAAEDDFHRTLCAHHRDFGGGPGIVQIAAQML